jgi:hypothetical protein
VARHVDCEAKRVESRAGYRLKAPGEFWYRMDIDEVVVTGMEYACPCGCGRQYGTRFELDMWDGNVDKPTVYVRMGMPPHWVGRLTEGKFIGE